MGIDRGTIRKYVTPAEIAGITPGGEPVSRAEWAVLAAGWFPELVDAKARSLTFGEINEHCDRIVTMLVTNRPIAAATATSHQSSANRRQPSDRQPADRTWRCGAGMNALTAASADELARLSSRARRGCVVVDAHTLPAGCSPSTGQVGLEVVPTTGATALHVERTIHYSGEDLDIAQWLERGTKSFDSVEAAVLWLGGTVPATPAPPTQLFVDASELVGRLGHEIVGQRQAIETMTRATSRHLARLTPRRPLSLLLIGPTGFGKALAAIELAAALREFTDRPWLFERLDMSEFSEAHSVAKLHGSPPGYVGYRDQTRLVPGVGARFRSCTFMSAAQVLEPKCAADRSPAPNR